MINKLTKTIGAMALVGLIALVGSVFAYDNFNNGVGITAEVNGETYGILAADISAVDTAITLEGGSTLVDGLALVGDELVTVSGGGTTIARAATHTHPDSAATTAAPHGKGDTIRNIAQAVDITFTATTALIATDDVVVAIPNNSPNTFGVMGAVDPSTVDVDARTFTLTGLTGVGPHTIFITGIDLPELEGQYLIPVEIRSESGTLVEMGSGNLSWANQVRVRAIIQPALVFTIDKSNIDITANPSVNNGENYAQRSVLSVATNALNGYTIYGMLEGKNTIANAQLDDGANAIVVGDSTTAENTFGYYVWDADVTKTAVEVKAQTGLSFDNNSAGVPSFLDVASAAVGFSASTNSHKHTVYYGLNVDYMIPSGEYEGTVTYTATPSF